MLADFAPWEVFARVLEVTGGYADDISIGLRIQLARRHAVERPLEQKQPDSPGHERFGAGPGEEVTA